MHITEPQYSVGAYNEMTSSAVSVIVKIIIIYLTSGYNLLSYSFFKTQKYMYIKIANTTYLKKVVFCH